MSQSRVILYDSSPNGANGLAWAGYSRLRPGWKSIGAKSWDEGCAALLELGTTIDEIQVWGHGSPGQPLIATQPIEHNHLLIFHAMLKPYDRRPLVWFRSCSVFFGAKGQRFARKAADDLGCLVAGHTRVIWFPWQSGLYVAKPGVEPDWPVDQGEPKDFRSSRIAPHTIFAGRMSIPKEWS